MALTPTPMARPAASTARWHTVNMTTVDAVDVGGTQVILHELDNPHCPICECVVPTVYRGGFWTCSRCGLCVSQEIEGTGGLRVPAYLEDENTDGARRFANASSEAYQNAERVLSRVRVDDAVHEFPGNCANMARALDLPYLCQARVRELAKAWHDARRGVTPPRRMPTLEYAMAAVIYRARAERNIPLTAFEVGQGKAGVTVYRHTYVRVLRNVALLESDLRLAPVCMKRGFVTRFALRATNLPEETEEHARRFMERRGRLKYPEITAVALLSLRGKKIDKTFIDAQTDLLGPRGATQAFARAQSLRREVAALRPSAE